ncbi:integrase [Vibrio cyclitrophicus FF160]|uniref:site-specific integrase n=1 Tax=Vibrio cyclitrophicus TaxID=47951 RepID=UPI0002E5A648|nr:site-specific integrase [Vibrio cyclitrophicus]OEE84111.1 integrase [Vibrio cyclitrophicus FF160]PMJ17553.1 integrase [Vibrio cyclitrophicus]PMO10495.1 integrase [Vibrio cyclitrophicus]
MGIIHFNRINLDEDFEIDYGNLFYDQKWTINIDPSETLSMNFERIKTNGDTKYHHDLITLVRMMTYYSFPKKVKLTLSSWYSTDTMFSAYITIANTFLIPKGYITKEILSNLTLEQCQNHLNKLMSLAKIKQPSSKQRLVSYCVFFDHWIYLSEKKYLPEKFRTQFKASELISKEKRKEITSIISDVTDPWTPLGAEVIEDCYKHAVKYIEVYSTTIVKCHNLIRTRARLGTAKGARRTYGLIRKDGKTKNTFEVLKKMNVPEISDGIKLFNFIPKTKRVRTLGYKSGWQDRTYIKIDEVRPEVIILKRACIFIIGLFTGLRRREIANLKAIEPFYENGTWNLNIIRFKTSDEPIEKGEPDIIPIPDIVVKAVNVLLKLFEVQRTQLESDYLITVDIVTKKGFKKAKNDTITKDITGYIRDITGIADGFPHRLRKSIAWLLISRSEANTDLIRQLFGHKSFGMTLRYILRNHLMAQGILELLEHNYTEDLKEILDEIASNSTSGKLSDLIKSRICSQKYKGQILLTDVEIFIKESLASGVPLFVSKIPIGGFCLRSGETKKIPPCMVKSGRNNPNIDFCNYKECDHIIHTDESKINIYKQIEYYQKLLGYINETSDERVVAYYEKEIDEHRDLIYKLQSGDISSDTFKSFRVIYESK